MKIAMSNIALPVDTALAAWPVLAMAGLNGVEVALTRIAPWEQLNAEAVISYRRALEDSGLIVPSLQAILFGVPDAHLLQSERQFEILESHLGRVARLGQLLGARVAVFGAPKQRQKGDLPTDTALDLGIARFGRLADVMSREGDMTTALEPAPTGYGRDFLTTASEVLTMVDAVAHPNLKINLDTGCALMAGEDFPGAVKAARACLPHVQISEPKLGDFTHTVVDHASAAAALRYNDYRGWLSIEMLEAGADPLTGCAQALSFAIRQYGPFPPEIHGAP